MHESDKNVLQESRPIGLVGWAAIVVMVGLVGGSIYSTVDFFYYASGHPAEPGGMLWIGMDVVLAVVVCSILLAGLVMLFYRRRKRRGF